MAKQINACCSKCDKSLINIKRVGIYCNECYNEKRRIKYDENIIESRKKANERSNILRKKKGEIQLKLKKLQQEEIESKIGENNQICKCCNKIVEKTLFRKNRLKCLICEREEYNKKYYPIILEKLKTNPAFKFKRTQRNRIVKKIKNKNKTTIQYLGCNSQDFESWLKFNSQEFTIENHSTIWHIDHVIPLSRFNLDNEEEQLIAFNWRNTTPMYCSKNLEKGNKIIKSQIEQHLEKLIEYHKNNSIEMPEKFIDLFAKYLDDGNTLKQSLPLTTGNVCEELG